MIKINTIGVREFDDRIKGMANNMRKSVVTVVRGAADQFRDLAIKDAPADVGVLRSQITVKEITDLSYEVISGSEYSAPMEFGTKGKFTPIPGVDSSEFQGKPTGGTFKEMLKNIENWVRRKGITGTYSVKTRRRTGNKATQQTQDKQVAYLIARSILNNGVTPHPYFFKQTPIVRRDLIRNLRNILKA